MLEMIISLGRRVILKMNKLSSKEEAVLIVLMSGKNAEDLLELSKRVEANPYDVAQVLDRLCEKDILFADTSYHRFDLGEIVYAFSFSDYAQQIYQNLLDENPWLYQYEESIRYFPLLFDF